MIIFTLFILNQLLCQNLGVNKSKTVKSSKRPNNIRNAKSHFAASGNVLHEYAGPQIPRPGPILPILEMTQPMDSE